MDQKADLIMSLCLLKTALERKQTPFPADKIPGSLAPVCLSSCISHQARPPAPSPTSPSCFLFLETQRPPSVPEKCSVLCWRRFPSCSSLDEAAHPPGFTVNVISCRKLSLNLNLVAFSSCILPQVLILLDWHLPCFIVIAY